MALTKNPIPDLGSEADLAYRTWLRLTGNGSEVFRKIFRTAEPPHTWAQHIWKEKKEKKIKENSLLGPVDC